MFVIDDKGNTIPEQSETFDLSLVSSSFKGENNLIYLDGQSLLFSTPIYDEKGISKVLIGIRDKENIQNLIKPKSLMAKVYLALLIRTVMLSFLPLILNHLCS